MLSSLALTPAPAPAPAPVAVRTPAGGVRVLLDSLPGAALAVGATAGMAQGARLRGPRGAVAGLLAGALAGLAVGAALHAGVVRYGDGGRVGREQGRGEQERSRP